jgi:hypothetical protein
MHKLRDYKITLRRAVDFLCCCINAWRQALDVNQDQAALSSASREAARNFVTNARTKIPKEFIILQL